MTEDPRLELHYTDAHAYLKQDERKYDVIIMDIADPIEAGPGYVLYTQVWETNAVYLDPFHASAGGLLKCLCFEPPFCFKC